MDKIQKVVWSEGMFLTPHHFQQWDRYYETFLAERFKTLTPFGWGVLGMDIDSDALVNGHFALLGFRGITPDGLVVNVPGQDFSPETRLVADRFSPSQEHLDVFLGVPSERLGEPNCQLDGVPGSRPTRYMAEYVKRYDYNSGENPREVAVARKNLKVFFSGEEMADYVTIKLAELVRTPGGTIALSESYVPSCLTLTASPYLLKVTHGLLELLFAKNAALSRAVSGGGGMDARDPARLALLKTINSYIPLLSHISHVASVHPETLYVALARLAGELSTFSPHVQLRELPRYQHTDLSKTFKDLEFKVRSMLEGATPTRYVAIPLESSRENVLAGRIADEKLLGSSQFFLAVEGDLTDEQMLDLVPRRVKVGSAPELDLIVTTAMPGVRLYHVPHPPESLPAKRGVQYFRLENRGEFWESVCQSKAAALYVPSDLKGLKFQLLATKE